MRAGRPARRHGSAGMIPAGLIQEVRSESPSSGAETRASHRPPARRPARPTILRARADRPEAQGEFAPEYDQIGMRPEAVGGPSLTTFVRALNGRADQRFDAALRVRGPGRDESAAARMRQGRRAFTTDSRGGLSRWSGGRPGRLDSWDGPSSTSRRRDRLRHRPHLENLDDRCLLSTGLRGHLGPRRADAPRVAHRP